MVDCYDLKLEPTRPRADAIFLRNLIRIRSYDSAADFLADSRVCLERRECENNLPLGFAGRFASRPASSAPDGLLLMGMLGEEGVTLGVAVMTPPRKMILSRIDGDLKAAVAALAGYLQRAQVQLPGVIGPSAEAEAFAGSWTRLSNGGDWEIDARLCVFECRQVNDINLTRGSLREATEADIPLLARWDCEFGAAIGEPRDGGESRSKVAEYIQEGTLHLWDTGTPVSMAKQSRPTANGIAVNMVYTPDEQRGRGYATACVHQLTHKLLRQGYSFCSLYTDASNSTSNSIYRRIGYQQTGTALDLGFEDDPNSNC